MERQRKFLSKNEVGGTSLSCSAFVSQGPTIYPKTPRRWRNHGCVSHLPGGTSRASVQESQLSPPCSVVFLLGGV